MLSFLGFVDVAFPNISIIVSISFESSCFSPALEYSKAFGKTWHAARLWFCSLMSTL